MNTSPMEVKETVYMSNITEIGKSQQKVTKVNGVGIVRKLHGGSETSQQTQK